MRSITFKKKAGGYRTIYMPTSRQKYYLRQLLPYLEVHQQKICPHAHGFIQHRNVVTNAEPHVGKRATINLDIQNFFEHITAYKAIPHLFNINDGHIPNRLLYPFLHFPTVHGHRLILTSRYDFLWYPFGIILLTKCFYKEKLRQGFPTSPAIANIIFAPIDDAIVAYLQATDPTAVYTRYADDLSISSDNDDPKHLHQMLAQVKNLIEKEDFNIHHKKTRIQYARAGRREICGVYVDDTGVHTNRKTRRRLRAMRFNAQKGQQDLQKLKGLEEFCKLKRPKRPNWPYQEYMEKLGQLQTSGDRQNQQVAQMIKQGIVQEMKKMGYKPNSIKRIFTEFENKLLPSFDTLEGLEFDEYNRFVLLYDPESDRYDPFLDNEELTYILQRFHESPDFEPYIDEDYDEEYDG